MDRRLISRRKAAYGQCFISLYAVKSETEFVTWKSNLDTPDDTYWGHYHTDVQCAEDDFKSRK